MTEPTNAEIRELWESYNPMHGIESFARAVLAKWGTPAVAGEPIARIEVERTKGGMSLTHIAEPAAFKLPVGNYSLYTTPQPTQAQAGDVVVTTDHKGQCVAVTRQDAEGKILSVIWHAPEVKSGAVPLTREQALEIVNKKTDVMMAIRLTEAAHGIKGGQHGAE